jgi:hypothetical protein
MSRRITLMGVLAVLVAAAIAAAVVAGADAAGGGGGRGGGGGGMAPAMAMRTSAHRGAEVVNVMASPKGRLRFTMTKLTVARPGTVTLRMSNPSSAGLRHGIAVEGHHHALPSSLRTSAPRAAVQGTSRE